MKKILFSILMLTSLSVVYGQKITNDNVPEAVKDAFKVKFIGVENETWEMDYDNYQADFKMNKVELEAKFDKDGKWLESATPVNHSNLPPAVKVCLQKNFDVYKESSIIKLEVPESTKYVFVIEFNGLEYDVVIGDKGDLIKKAEIKEYKKN